MEVLDTPLAGCPALTLRTDRLEAVVLVGKGADVYALRSLDTGVDPLWKARWGPEHLTARAFAADSGTDWLARTPGGWQVPFPSGGVESAYGGTVQPQHGEGSVVPWRVDAVDVHPDRLRVTVSCRLTRSPLSATRTFSLRRGSYALEVDDDVVNDGGEPWPLTFTHHPTLGEPFLGRGCRIATNAVRVELDDTYLVEHSPYEPGAAFDWPGSPVDLSVVPEPGRPRRLLAYLSYEPGAAWYAVDNPELATRFRVDWEGAVLPYAWFFQEMHGGRGYPWFSNTRIMAIEPATTTPARGLSHAVEAGGATVLEPGASVSFAVRATVEPLG